MFSTRFKSSFSCFLKSGDKTLVYTVCAPLVYGAIRYMKRIILTTW
jgi:hypothetical protein